MRKCDFFLTSFSFVVLGHSFLFVSFRASFQFLGWAATWVRVYKLLSRRIRMMRAKHILNFLPLGSKIRIVHERCSLNSITAAFFVVALAHCLVQIALQAVAYSANTTAGLTVTKIIRDAHEDVAFTYVDDNGALRRCDGPTGKKDACRVIAGPGSAQDDPASPADKSKRAVDMSIVDIFPRDVNASVLDDRCIEALNWPQSVLYDARREDVSFLIFQIWLLGISIVTILNESIPHLIAALVTHALSSIWSVFQVSRTHTYMQLYRSLVVQDACNGVNVLSGFWAKRLDYFVPILALNIVAFVMTFFFSYKLFKVYARQTFKRVGSLPEMNVLYSIILTFSVALQLSAFFVICSSALWLDVLFKGSLAQFVVDRTASRIIFIHICVWTLPWVFVGWTAFRRENKLWTTIFFIVGAAFIAAWSSIFPSDVYKQKFNCFPFFAAVTVSSFAMLVITFVLALVCRVNFGKGLSQYLRSQDLIDESLFIPVFMTRRRQSVMTTSVVFPDKRKSLFQRDDLTMLPQEKRMDDKYQDEIEVMHDLESVDLRLPARSLDPESVPGPSISMQQHGRRSFLRSWRKSATEKSDPRTTWFSTMTNKTSVITFPVEAHRSERSVSPSAPIDQVEWPSGVDDSSIRAERNASTSSWSASQSVLTSSWSSPSTSPSLPWQASPTSSQLSPLPSHVQRLDYLDGPIANSSRSSLGQSNMHAPMSPALPSSGRASVLSRNPSSRVAPQSRKVGLPTGPSCTKESTDVTGVEV